MSKLETLLKDGLKSELMLQQQLRALSETLRQQLQETERKQIEELERRIQQNALLSTDVEQESGDNNELNYQTKIMRISRSTSISSLTSGKETSYHPRKSGMPNSSSSAYVSSIRRSNCSVRTSVLAQQCEGRTLCKTTQMIKEEEDEAECLKKFCALPVPNHVNQPPYQEMIEMREKERKQEREERKNFLLSLQKPFSFLEREREKREKLIAMVNQVSQGQKNNAHHKVEKDLSESEQKDQDKMCRKDSTQTTVGQENHTASGAPKLRTSERTRKEKLGFLDEKLSFHPKTIHQVPDFSRLHKALQTETLRKTQCKDVTKCQPFVLRTSALPARPSKMSPENSQVSKMSNLSRSKSLGTLTSLSTDTLPTFITDAARKRCMAIRKSMEMRDSKNQESADWLRKYQMRSQAMKKTVALHAKLLDPHSSLKDVYNEKLQHHREADQQRMREYMRELRDIKERVSERPYLFERVKQRNAKARAEQTYRNKLKNAGLKEQFVEENGGVSISSTSEFDADVNDCSTENGIHIREENADDREKIEDVEEESVKSKGEEMQ